MLDQLKTQLINSGSITFKAKITPKSGRHEISGFLADGTMKIKIKTAPEQGKANEEVIKLLSEQFKLPAKKISILKGQTSPIKTIIITN